MGYGGTWLDASVLMVKPMSVILNGSTQAVFEFGRGTLVRTASWFLMAVPGDPFMLKTRACLNEAFRVNPEGKLIEDLNIFSSRQLVELDKRGITTYYVVSGCFWKAIDEDMQLQHRFSSRAVRHLNASQFALLESHGHVLFNTMDPH